ncbi:MAG: hypothetical protein OFPI_33660 [Osedax symbiont Rs2]|nr:MAG: hypothetical protein OFPI_33660 [Osedax symbiont Rs2]
MHRYQSQRTQASFQLHGHPGISMRDSLQTYVNLEQSAPGDAYGSGAIINDFEHEIALELGKQQANFFPSGTMAQQVALRIACDNRAIARVAYHPLCHLQIHEQQGLKHLHRIDSVLLGEPNRLFSLQDLQSAEGVAAVLFELPQREIGGQLPAWDELQKMSDWCRQRGIHSHLDGARLFEILAYYKKTAAQVCALFDSVYISFYKGFGGVSGAILAADRGFMDSAKLWKRRHGGDIFQLYPYVVSAQYNYRLRRDKMPLYWKNALSLAEQLNQIPGISTVPKKPVSNMFHVYFTVDRGLLEASLIEVLQKYDLALLPGSRYDRDNREYFEFWAGDQFSAVDPEVVTQAICFLAAALKREDAI